MGKILRIKVAYLMGSFNRGGAEALMLDVFNNAHTANYDMMCVHRNCGVLYNSFLQTRVPLYYLSPHKRGVIRYLIDLRKLLLCEQVNIVHAQYWIDALYGWLASMGTPIRVVNTYHGFYTMRGWRGFLCRMSLRLVDIACFVSNYEKQWFLKHCHFSNAKAQTLYNGIEFSKIMAVKPSDEFTNRPMGIRLAMVGNFVSVRSQIIICKAIKNLKERGDTNFDFYFIGRRDDKEVWRYDECVQYCEKYKLTNVHFMGSQGDVPSLLKVMDGFVYSTAHDSFGIAVIEAIAAELPIVVNDWPVMKEVCNLGLPRNNNAIRFFRTEDVEDCAQQIAELINDFKNKSDKLHNDCEQASAAVRHKYDIKTYIHHLESIYNNIA